MFLKKKTEVKQERNSIVGLGTIINGNISCQGNLMVYGNVDGDISADSEIIIGDSAVITGNASADSITIGGMVEGNITSTGILRILSTAKLNGDINVGGFIADEGGIFVGRCYIVRPPQKLLESMFVEKREKNILLKKLAVNE